MAGDGLDPQTPSSRQREEMPMFKLTWIKRLVQTWRVLAAAGGAAAGVALLFWVRGGTYAGAQVQQTSATTAPTASTSLAGSSSPSDYRERVVAYLNDGIVITREDLGEYLIARYGPEKLELLVNRRIIEETCKKHGIEVTATEVEADLQSTVEGLGIDRVRFVKEVLKNYHMNLIEWKEDVVRPKLLMNKLVLATERDKVRPTEKEIDSGFEAYYGEKLDCRIIVWPKAERKAAEMEYAKLRDSEDEFARKAKSQANSMLASRGGHIDPIAHHTAANEELEKEAFSLQAGEVSRLLETPDGYVVIKVDKRIAPESSVNKQAVSAKLEKEIQEKKIQREIPLLFAQMKKDYEPRLMLKSGDQKLNVSEVERNLPTNVPGPQPMVRPPGN
jgi:hypothetical protein